MSCKPCHASRGHSMIVTGSISGLQNSGFELWNIRIQGSRLQCPDECIASLCGINDGVDPQAGGSVARVCLMFVGCADGFEEFLFCFLVHFFTFALELLQLDFNERACGGFATHYRVTRGGPGKDEARIVRLAAHSIVSRAEAATANDGDFGHDAVGDRIHHFGAGADDAAPFGVFAYHKSIYIVKKDQRDAILIAIENEARSLLGGLGVNHAPELDALLIRAWRECLHMLFLIGDDADCPAADASVSAEHRFAVFGAIFFKLAAVDN